MGDFLMVERYDNELQARGTSIRLVSPTVPGSTRLPSIRGTLARFYEHGADSASEEREFFTLCRASLISP
jgi:hypothetical protein